MPNTILEDVIENPVREVIDVKQEVLIKGEQRSVSSDCPAPHENRTNNLPKYPDSAEELIKEILANAKNVKIQFEFLSEQPDMTSGIRRSEAIIIEHLIELEEETEVKSPMALLRWGYEENLVRNEQGEHEFEEAQLGFFSESNVDRIKKSMDEQFSNHPDTLLDNLHVGLDHLRTMIAACPLHGFKVEGGSDLNVEEAIELLKTAISTWTPVDIIIYPQPCVRQNPQNPREYLDECSEHPGHRMPVVNRNVTHQFDMSIDRPCASQFRPVVSVSPLRLYFKEGKPEPEDKLGDDGSKVLNDIKQWDEIVTFVEGILEKTSDFRAIVRGYADKQGSGSYDNHALSMSRARWVRDRLEQEFGSKLGHIQVRACSDHHAPGSRRDSPQHRVAVVEFVAPPRATP